MVAAALPNSDPVHKITILPAAVRSDTMVLPTKKYQRRATKCWISWPTCWVVALLREMVFHDPTTGAANDIERGNRSRLRAMVTQ